MLEDGKMAGPEARSQQKPLQLHFSSRSVSRSQGKMMQRNISGLSLAPLNAKRLKAGRLGHAEVTVVSMWEGLADGSQ